MTTYRALVSARADGLDFSQVRCVALDEYVGIPASDPASYHSFIRREIADPLELRPTTCSSPTGTPPTWTAACVAFEDGIRSLGGVGIQLLGIGRNGHVGFNEPGSPFGSRTRVARLSETTRADNARFFARPEDVPTHCLTQGLGTILDAAAARARRLGVAQGRGGRRRRGGAGDRGVPRVRAPAAPARDGDRRSGRRGRAAPDRPSPRLARRRLARLTR